MVNNTFDAQQTTLHDQGYMKEHQPLASISGGSAACSNHPTSNRSPHMRESDWLYFPLAIKIKQQIQDNSIQIKMEEESVRSVLLAPSPQDSNQSLLSEQPSFPEDQQTLLIARLLSLGRPLFEVTKCPARISLQEFLDKQKVKQKILSYNRKEKSLEELCKKFIDNFQGHNNLVLELDKVTIQLNVERRRIYDIINILESLDVVKKAGKNHYVWRGLKEAVRTIHQIRDLGESHASGTHKKEKSLEHLAYRFLKLFINSLNPLSLEEAARILIPTEDSAMIKTKIRRLYDIVNVFKSLGLVHKVHIPCKKPGFSWLGATLLQNIIQERKQKVMSELTVTATPQEEKQNKRELINREPREWLGLHERSIFMEFSMMRSFSQKIFFPSIIRKESSAFTLVGSQSSLTDVCAQY